VQSAPRLFHFCLSISFFSLVFVYSGVAVEHVDPITLGRTTGFADAIGEHVTVC
jgi:hypothetical protein